MLRIVVDAKIPFLRGIVEQLPAEVTYLDGGSITAADVKEADALIVRTRTRCDRALLEGSRVRFIATATIGYDHLDTAYLREAGIAWTNCPGCNASSVGQYVASTLRLLALHGAWSGAGLTAADCPVTAGREAYAAFGGLTLGIVGVGHVGRAVAQAACALGIGRILLNDPPREAAEGPEGFYPLERLLAESDVVTLHTPLTREPQSWPTFHLAGEAFFEAMKPGAILINAARGSVVDTPALVRALETERLRAAVIDTWEGEPRAINPRLLSLAWLATPHIAGYSADGKARGSQMALTAVSHHFGIDPDHIARLVAQIVPPALPPVPYAYCPEGPALSLGDEALRRYDPTRDSLALKARPEDFEQLRGHYPLRRE